ncbi:binary toxin-like calcium binding domain-containing protein [Acidobacteriota bacterium]
MLRRLVGMIAGSRKNPQYICMEESPGVHPAGGCTTRYARSVSILLLVAVVFLGAVAPVANAEVSQKKQCKRTTCRPEKKLCMTTFSGLYRESMARCADASGNLRKRCEKDKKKALQRNRKKCRDAFKECTMCCEEGRTECSVPVEIPITLGTLHDKLVAAGGGPDSDLDYLPDSIEEFLGTDAYSRDSDGDSIHDYNELFGFEYFDNDAAIPDSDGDGIIDPNDAEDNDKDLYDWLSHDNDDDGIPNYLEYYGYTYDWMSGSYRLWDGQSFNQLYFKTDPLQPSTDQDPYGDAMEISGTLMDVSVRDPGNMPMVPAYPNIVITLEGYHVTLNQNITISEGKSLAKGTNWSRSTTSQTSHTSEKFWEAGGSITQSFEYKISVTPGVTGKTEVALHAKGGARTASTNTRTSTRSVGSSITDVVNWQKATSINPTDVAHIKLFLKVRNHGTSAASNVIPTFILKIGGMNIATFQQAEAQINILPPGGEYPPQVGTYWVVHSVDTGSGAAPLSLNLEELRALEAGAPVSIVMAQMLADVILMNSDGHWEKVGNWGEYMARCEAVSANMFLDIGDGNFIHYLVHSDESPSSPRVTFRDALMWVAGGSTEENDNTITFLDRLGEEQTISLKDWDFQFDVDTLTKNGFVLTEDNQLLPPAPDYNTANLVLGPDTVIVGKPPRTHHADENSPFVHYAYVDERMDVLRVCASDYMGVEKATFQDRYGILHPMEELVFNSGIYTLAIDSSYESNGSETVTVVSTDPSASPAVVAVEKLEYPKEEPVPPTIADVYFRPLHNVLTAHVLSDPQYPVTSVKAYHRLLDDDGKVLENSSRWWEDENGYQAYLENINHDNFSGLYIIAISEGHGRRAYSSRNITEAEIIKDGFHGDVRMVAQYRCANARVKNIWGFWKITCCNWNSIIRPCKGKNVMRGRKTEFKIAKLDLDRDGDTSVKYSIGSIELACAPFDFLYEFNWHYNVFQPELNFQDLWMARGSHVENDIEIFLGDRYCIYDGGKSFSAITAVDAELAYQDCWLRNRTERIVLDIESEMDASTATLPLILIMKTDQGRISKVSLYNVDADCPVKICTYDRCIWKKNTVGVRYVTFVNEICDDDVDNDLNGKTDCYDQPECSLHPSCTSIPPEICDDDIDNDFDNATDCRDGDCVDHPHCIPESDCANKEDDEGDGLTDCDDPDCIVKPDCPETICDDGVDNNHNNLTDCQDIACCGFEGCVSHELGDCCFDGIDNDADGCIDCADDDCLTGNSLKICLREHEVSDAQCEDKIDNDADRYIDCKDTDCQCKPACNP